jgi:tetrahydromethanopterin S-methyltransferase subunit H
MADLTTLAGIEAELADTADYDVTLDVSKAKRRAAAPRRKLDFPQSTGRGEQNIAFAMQPIENQLQQVLAWISVNDTPEQSLALRRVTAALDKQLTRLTNGRRVVNPCDALKYLLEQVCVE